MSTIPVYVFAKWQVKEGNFARVQSLLEQVARATRQEKGNLQYQVYLSTDDAHTLLLFEGYVDEQAAAAHRHSDHYQNIVVQSIIPLLENREIYNMKPLTL